ncbi:TetR/AcrR family transcriptional regulator [Mucilaginibacter aquatilis]|uniref:TetR family transcriptional regulator n=1 Tax=Mucilaginibacter aquatilis TaxID=1517760 RepID=A0A6I4IAY5_9SPHI|nr:TetR/AcrR family transcriptional regulator [Mucilaginibacter aquatilis]MVN92117.1 TetR family transcriptional regulator [Mucilaginibacter aquatilis]
MEKEKTDKRDHILDVAERVFSEHGFDGASTRLISGEAGVNMAMLNYYFGSKEGLLLSLFERRTSTFHSLIQGIGNNENMSSWQKVSEYVEAYINRVFSNNCFQKVVHQELAVRRTGELADKITDMIMQNVIEFRKILHEGIERGEFKNDIDTEMVVATVFGVKAQIVNASHISSLMLGYDTQDPQNMVDKLKPRVTDYLKKLLKAYLLTEHDNAK